MSENGRRRKKKGFYRKLAESSVRMRVEKKKRKDLYHKLVEFLVQNVDEDQNKKRPSPQIGRIFGRIKVLHHKLVSPQNGDTRGEPPL